VSTQGDRSETDGVIQALRCPCRLELTGESADALVEAAEAHLGDQHPRLVGAYDRDDIQTDRRLHRGERTVTEPRKVAVAGASGLIGQAALNRFVSAGYDVVGMARRTPIVTEGATTVWLDLMDADACRPVIPQHAAPYELPGLVPGWFDEDAIERNATMFRYLSEAIEAAGCPLEHVSLMHGTKAYRLHAWIEVTPEMIPPRERLPCVEHRNFYFEQERHLQNRQAKRGFGLAVYRPTVVYGVSVGNNMNPLLPILVYAVLLRDSGEPLHRPWAADRPARLQEAVDADLIAEALLWAADSQDAPNETFNLTNGDAFIWEGVWPAIGRALGTEAGEHRPISFTDDLRARSKEWANVVDCHGLAASRGPRRVRRFQLPGVRGHHRGRLQWRTAGPRKQHPQSASGGFHACVDTKDMFIGQIARLQAIKMIPRSEQP
jgi:nucleoside-diphosphate-sugar epimerase